MSRENVEIVRRAIELLERRDWHGMTDLFDPSVELHGTVGGIEEGKVLRGPGEIRHAFETEDDEVWDEHRIEPHEFVEVGEHVVVPQTGYIRGRDGIEAAARITLVWTIRDGAIVRISMYQERQDALEAVGLSE